MTVLGLHYYDSQGAGGSNMNITHETGDDGTQHDTLHQLPNQSRISVTHFFFALFTKIDISCQIHEVGCFKMFFPIIFLP